MTDFRVFAPALLLACLLSSAAWAEGKADLILLHGSIKTGLPGKTVQALAVQGGQIIAAGNDREIQALATAGTKVIDLEGREATPGLIETNGAISAGSTPLEIEKTILAEIDALHRRGVTSVRDVGIGQTQWDAYRALLAVDNLPERVCVTWAIGTSVDSARTAMDNLASAPRAPASFGDGRLISCGPDLSDKGVDPAAYHAMVKMLAVAGFTGRSAKGRSAASLLYLDGITGTLQKGKRADIAVWDQGKCIMTLIGGDEVYRLKDDMVPDVTKQR
jgi:predicted amidohydrolase YtcJ